MLKPIDNWDQIEGIEMGEREEVKLGGHEVVIKNAYEYKSEVSGTTSLKIEVDIAGNDKQAGFYQRMFDSITDLKNKKWSNGACKYVSLKEEEKCQAMFKGFITAVENSNPGYKWNWDETSLIGKKLCGVFGLEEYEKQDGSIGTSVKLTQFRSLDKLPEVRIPRVKLINGTYVDYDSYQPSSSSTTSSTSPFDGILETVDDGKMDAAF